MKPMTIKGNWLYKEAEVRTAQSERFIFIDSNGSKWADEIPGEIEQLLDILKEYPLNPSFEKYGNFIAFDPCSAMINPNFNYAEGNKEPQWIDGQRIFDVDGVVHFFGNFSELSHVFSIYTNDAETIEKLSNAIRSNQQSAAYTKRNEEIDHRN